MEEGTRMAKPIVVIDTSEIIEGKLPELETDIHELAAFVESNEPRPISYNVFLNQVGMQMTVVRFTRTPHRWSSTWTWPVRPLPNSKGSLLGMRRRACTTFTQGRFGPR
jgi:hypothetical protein